MFSDTHFHFSLITEQNGTEYGAEILSGMAFNRTFFALDVGTKANDLKDRAEALEASLSLLPDSNQKSMMKKSIFLSAGIWPDADSVQNKYACIEELRDSIEDFKNSDSIFSHHLVAIGEGGIDHHWNPTGVDERNEDDFGSDMLLSEKELFSMQLELARELDLPFIIHSRDGFEDTIDVLRSVRYGRGIVHCFSYGIEEARAFLDLGWHIAFGGATTYTKKAKMDDLISLLNFIPKDRILLETDAPYLAPVPMRGKENSPLYIKYTYEFIAEKIGISVDKLCRIVDENCASLFSIRK